MARLIRDYPFLGESRARRLASSYGSLCLSFLDNACREEDLGEAFGAGLTAAEVDYLLEREWARDADDILWRRTKLGLRLSADEVDRLSRYITHRREAQAA